MNAFIAFPLLTCAYFVWKFVLYVDVLYVKVIGGFELVLLVFQVLQLCLIT